MSDEMKNIIKKLNGVAAVNLSEPSEGDLERVTNAYHEARAQLAEKDEEIARLKESNITLNKMLDATGLSAELTEARELVKEAIPALETLTGFAKVCASGGSTMTFDNTGEDITQPVIDATIELSAKLDAWLKGG
jgi:thymidine phosphorylase